MVTLTRRSFVVSAAATALIRRGRAAAERYPISFSTLGCPKWDWKTILAEASRSGYAAIELRGIQGEMDLAKVPEFSPSRIAATQRDLEALGLKISDLGSSARMHEPDPTKRAAQMDEGRRFIDLAHRLGVPYIRVFPDKYVPGEPRQATLERIAAGLRELGERGRGSGVTVLMESHGDLTDSPSLVTVMKAADLPAVALLWDTHHTVVAGKETPARTFEQVGRWVRHTHIKDSVAQGDEHRYVLTGKGSVPVHDIVRILARGGYRGYYGFEWEKAWHPEIDEPEIAIPHYAETLRRYLADEGVKGE